MKWVNKLYVAEDQEYQLSRLPFRKVDLWNNEERSLFISNFSYMAGSGCDSLRPILLCIWCYTLFFLGVGGGVVEVRLEVGKQMRKDKCVHLFRK